MAAHRYPRRAMRGRVNRQLAWSALVDTAFLAQAAGVIRTFSLMSAGAQGSFVDQTHLRSVGVLSITPQADVDTHVFFGIYVSAQTTGATNLILDPSVSADVAIEKWLWWSCRSSAVAAGTEVGTQIIHIPFDVKVKRVLTSDQELLLSISSPQAINSKLGIRSLSKVTGTR